MDGVLMSDHSAHGRSWDAQRLRVLQRDSYLCYYCRKDLIGDDATVDHVMPIKLDPKKPYRDDELVAACRSCNSSKRDSVLVRLDFRSPDWFS